MKMAVLPLLYAVAICCAVLVYQNQEYGNLPIIPAEKQNMSVISVERETDLSAQTKDVGVYKIQGRTISNTAKQFPKRWES
ncbi:hypothetical protein C823_006800 [Eubacterium plexicaudatum ASF492]|nr:hypothetical protein C823_006800 [Eubacterium plexicaudatum ASF492]